MDELILGLICLLIMKCLYIVILDKLLYKSIIKEVVDPSVFLYCEDNSNTVQIRRFNVKLYTPHLVAKRIIDDIEDWVFPNISTIRVINQINSGYKFKKKHSKDDMGVYLTVDSVDEHQNVIYFNVSIKNKSKYGVI